MQRKLLTNWFFPLFFVGLISSCSSEPEQSSAEIKGAQKEIPISDSKTIEDALESRIIEIRQEFKKLNGELIRLSDLGVVNSSFRATLYERYIEARKRNDPNKDELKKKINVNELYGSEYDSISKIYEENLSTLMELERKTRELKEKNMLDSIHNEINELVVKERQKLNTKTN